MKRDHVEIQYKTDFNIIIFGCSCLHTYVCMYIIIFCQLTAVINDCCFYQTLKANSFFLLLIKAIIQKSEDKA